jgi:hypothetical protein
MPRLSRRLPNQGCKVKLDSIKTKARQNSKYFRKRSFMSQQLKSIAIRETGISLGLTCFISKSYYTRNFAFKNQAAAEEEAQTEQADVFLRSSSSFLGLDGGISG